MSDQIFWYVSRSSGLVAWLAAAGSILVGVMAPSRLLGRRPTIPWLIDLHRMLAALSSVFLVIHLGSLWFDHFVQFRWADLLVPWVAEVPGLSRTSLALGVIAVWFAAVVELTSLVRDHLPLRLWRSIHLTSYLVLALGTIHAIQTGSDIGNPLVAAAGVSTLTAVVLATAVRVRRARLAQRPPARGPTATPPPRARPRADDGILIGRGPAGEQERRFDPEPRGSRDPEPGHWFDPEPQVGFDAEPHRGFDPDPRRGFNPDPGWAPPRPAGTRTRDGHRRRGLLDDD